MQTRWATKLWLKAMWQVNPNVLLCELGLAKSILEVNGAGAPIEHEHENQEKLDHAPCSDQSASVKLSLLMLSLDAESSLKFLNVAIRGMLTLEQPKTWQNICHSFGLRNFDPGVLAFEFHDLFLHGKDPFSMVGIIHGLFMHQEIQIRGLGTVRKWSQNTIVTK